MYIGQRRCAVRSRWRSSRIGRRSRSRQARRSRAVTYRAPSGMTLRLMLDETNLGAEARSAR